ncbi:MULTISPECIES: hypothetical protein [Streptosporangium]|uniref:Uncharacterized protein n=1 Tax=Streptosporangium brasiliense TaxID=47480 RepID=A0ABT9RKL6_9ACTN|nr:hypothetical protein [Streptosporangium brasiliense]MDP9869848.1 hypothetical protein [Streptosporangium brasiliense]
MADFIGGAAHAAGLPLPSSTEDYDDGQEQPAIEDNALAAVLLVCARLSLAGRQPHRVGGPDSGTVLGSIPAKKLDQAAAEVMMGQVGSHHHDMFSRLLHYLSSSTLTQVDLRTVAALAYAVPDRQRELYSNPTGHYRHRLGPESGTSRWWPALDFAQSFWRTRPAG